MKSKSPTAASPRKPAKNQPPPRPPVPESFLVAGVGASAGGIESFTELLKHLPVDTGIAFVLVQHLDPRHPSMLTELLAKATAMGVEQVREGIVVHPDRVYVIPPNTSMSIAGRSLHLAARGKSRAAPMPIDRFMRSLAEQLGDRSIGIVLSGSGSDGTLGLAEIQARGGVTFVQRESTASYRGMPHSAIADGRADYILPPKGIARELVRIAAHRYMGRGKRGREVPALDKIFFLLRKATRLDFTYYRRTTLLRRIQRRMVVHQLERLRDYADYLQDHPAEIKALYQDMLISVTSFFRNPRVFEAMKEKVFLQILKREGPRSVRIWTPGCASGEETYSVAIALLEYLGEDPSGVAIQLFGTDVSEANIAKAREGFYPENIQGNVSADRLRKFFTPVKGGYRVRKSIRDLCIFAHQDIFSDPPFSHMDLICCRNLLIYLEPIRQNRALSLFHYAARPSGFLVLGASEGLGAASGLFAVQDRALKIFSKKAASSPQPVSLSLDHSAGSSLHGSFRNSPKSSDARWLLREVQTEFDHRLLTHYVPAAVFINDEMQIVHTRGNVNRYLTLAPGRATLGVLKMVREGIALALHSALERARKEKRLVKTQGVEVKSGDAGGESVKPSSWLIDFDVLPFVFRPSKEPHFMIVFRDSVLQPTAVQRPAKALNQSKFQKNKLLRLGQELAVTKEYLQSVIDTHESTNEELQAANEEILSSNEELQSTNEELETAKEELQSTNEELGTVNDELRLRNIETTIVNDDLVNLLSSIEIAVLMVASDLTIRRFTPRAQQMLGLLPGDVGRPLVNIRTTLEIPELNRMVAQVMSDARVIEREIEDRQRRSYQLRIRPYRRTDNTVDGAVITIVDLSSQTIPAASC